MREIRLGMDRCDPDNLFIPFPLGFGWSNLGSVNRGGGVLVLDALAANKSISRCTGRGGKGQLQVRIMLPWLTTNDEVLIPVERGANSKVSLY